MNVAEGASALVVAVTVYVPPDAPEATVNPPVNVPLDIEQDAELRSPDGEDERVHVAPL